MKGIWDSISISALSERLKIAGMWSMGLIALILVSGNELSGQENEEIPGQVRGRVYNEMTQRYLNNANVRVEGTSIRTRTNSFGEYTLRNVPAGEQTIVISYTGMDPERGVVMVSPGETTTHDVTFTRRSGDEEIFELEEFVVDSSDFQSMQELAVHEERHSVNLKNVVSTDSYGLVAQGNVGEFVKHMPGVTIGYGGSGAAGGTYSSGADANTISIRGYSARETNIQVDGMSMANAAPGTLDPATGLDMMSINNASRVEVIKVPSPDQPNSGVGGTVNLISKSAFEYSEPTLNFRVYMDMNTKYVEDMFEKTPGPMDEPTYKTMPGVDFSYAYPVNDKFGFTLTLSSVNSSNINNTLKSRITRDPEIGKPKTRSPDSTFTLGGEDYNYWIQRDPRFNEWQEQYGEDWTEWSEADFKEMYGESGASEKLIESNLNDVKRLPKYDQDGNLVGAWSPGDKENFESSTPVYYDEEGNRVGHVFNDWGHPYVHRVQVTDSPRIQHRNSGALKFDWRPFDGVLITANYQVSTFEDEDANRRVHYRSGDPFEFGPDYLLSNEGSVRLDTDAFAREGTTQTGYIKAEYMKGPWEISGHISQSESESDLLSIENGHFSVIQITTETLDLTEFKDINREGVPDEINYYRNITDQDGNVTDRELVDIGALSNYNISGFDPEDPQAGELRVRAGGINSESTVNTAKLDVRRELDFIPIDFANLAVKAGFDWEEKENIKGGRGANYEYVYLGEEDNTLSIENFRDDNYVGVDPGFGMAPLEWPDASALYEYSQEYPNSFSDTDDTVPSDGQSVAANNYIEQVNTSKAITETTTSYYWQVEGDFLDSRLSVVGGIRMSESERDGYAPSQNTHWNSLHYDRDENGDGIRDVFEGHEGIAIDPKYNTDTLGQLDVTGPTILLSHLRRERVSTFDQLSESAQEDIMTWFGYYEEAGAVYADGEPFIASEFERVQRGSLRATQYQYIKDYRIDQNAQDKPQPIISAAYDITDKLVARVSWSTTYSNPPYESSQGAGATLREFSFNENADGSGSMNITNPDLEISKTIGWDVGLSYYTERGGKYSITLYHKTQEDRPIDVFYSPSGNREAWEDVMDEIGFGPGSYYRREGQEWSVGTSVNAGGTFIDYGYELEGRQDLSSFGGWGRHFYVYGSFFQQFEEPGDVPEEEAGDFNIRDEDETKINASGGINFSYKRIELRVNATWRNERTADRDDAFIDGIFWNDATVGNAGWYTPSEDDNGNDSYRRRVRLVRPSDLRIDLSGSYKLTDHLTLDFSARNITKSYPAAEYELEDGGKLPHLGAIHDQTEKAIYGVNFTIGLSGTY